MKYKKNSESYSSNSQSLSNEKDSINLSSDENSSNDLYEAEEIIGKKIKKGKVLYKVKWKDYPISQSTWEPISNFNNTSFKLIKKFENTQKEKLKKLSAKGLKPEQDKRFSKRLKVRSKKNTTQVEEIVIEDSESEVLSSDNEKSKPLRKKRESYCEDDSSIDSAELSPVSSDSSDKKAKSEIKIVENGRKIFTHRSKKSAFKSKLADIKYDKVKRIISGKITDTKNFQLKCLVEFEKRPDGFTPEPRHFSSEILRIHAPQSLIDFYQSRISINKKSP